MVRHKKMYVEFILTRDSFNIINKDDGTDINMMTGEDTVKSFCECLEKAVDYYVTNFKFQNIVFDKIPAPRYNTATTNISELIGFIMKTNGARYNNPVLFFKMAIQVYTNQVEQLLNDF